jgi:serine/threonine protein kinase/tetratricopeptide (TPR) repeat protein
MTGTTVGHYRVLDRLGAGGMGVVYRAEDVRLGRMVAVKFLSEELSGNPSAVSRFEREARAASALSHPNVCAIYDVGHHDGQPFLVMELLEGTSLQERIGGRPLPPEVLLDLGVQIAEALSAAHAAGIVHRDVKPANVFVTSRGTAKLVDFGLARVVEDAAGASQAATAAGALTVPGSVVGTVAYMSPEQVRGEALDSRTDIFSFGAVLYEMATGRRAFTGATLGAIHDAILNRTPVAPAELNVALPPELAAIITRAMEKDPTLRYQHAATIVADLQRLRRKRESDLAPGLPVARHDRRTAPRRVAVLFALALLGGAAAVFTAWRWHVPDAQVALVDSIAVLPFVNETGVEDSDYLSDGITDSLINRLSSLGDLRVAARSASFRHKATPDPQAAGGALGVRAVLAGRLLQRGDTLIVRTELIQVSDGSQLWGGEFTSASSDVFDLQRRLSGEIASQLRSRLTDDQRSRLASRETTSDEAYRLYLRGRYQWNKRSAEGMRLAIGHFTQAVDKDPSYALAHAALADAFSRASFFNVARPRDLMPKAKAAAELALSIDPELAPAHMALVYVALTFDWDWAAATRHLDRAMALDRRTVEAHTAYPFYLTVAGRHAEAVEVARRAFEDDVLSASLSHNLAVQLSLAGRHAEAVDECRRTIELDAGFAIAHQVMAGAYAAMGRYADALPPAERAVALDAGNVTSLAFLGFVHARLGRRVEAQALVAKLVDAARHTYVPPLAFAVVYEGLRDRDNAFKWLEAAYEERHNRLAYLRVEPVWEGLRADRRYAALLERIGLPAGVAVDAPARP